MPEKIIRVKMADGTVKRVRVKEPYKPEETDPLYTTSQADKEADPGMLTTAMLHALRGPRSVSPMRWSEPGVP